MILKPPQSVLKSPQITPEVPKSVHLGHIFLLGLAKTVFLHCPVLYVSTRVEKKQAMCISRLTPGQVPNVPPRQPPNCQVIPQSGSP